jgi:predicted ferric reductase
MWFTVPGIIFVLESLRRLIWRSSSRGITHVQEAKLLPSRVIHLSIRKPISFIYNAGDYVYINIPSISIAEWHPFTISSAPEQESIKIL